MSEGYIYTTLSDHPGQPVRIGVSFYLDELAYIEFYGAEPGGRPFLNISHGDVSVRIGSRGYVRARLISIAGCSRSTSRRTSVACRSAGCPRR